MKTHLRSLLALGVWLAISPTFGAPAGYRFTGAVNLVFGNPFNGVTPQLGDSVTGQFSYDSAAATTNNINSSLAYFAQNLPFSYSFTLRGVTFRTDGDFMIAIQNTRSYDQFALFDHSPAVGGVIPPANSTSIEFVLGDLNNRTFSDVSLPTSLTLADFNSNWGEISTVSGGLASGVTFSINSLTPMAIPEISSGSLLLVGMTSLALRRRRGLIDRQSCVK